MRKNKLSYVIKTAQSLMLPPPDLSLQEQCAVVSNFIKPLIIQGMLTCW